MHPLATEENLAQPVIRRLGALRRLSDQGVALLQQAVREGLQRTDTGDDLINEGDPVDGIRVILSGWLCRYKMLEDGRRQIVNFILPGETCDAYSYLLPSMDHSIATLTPVVYAEIKRAQFEKMVAADRSLAEAFWCETLVNAAVQREWAVNLGRRVALERVAHLFCEIFERLHLVGLADENSCAFPLTQTDLADATGLSVVHVNRTLQEMRHTGLIVLRERTLIINNVQALRDAALFSPNYLFGKAGR